MKCYNKAYLQVENKQKKKKEWPLIHGTIKKNEASLVMSNTTNN